MSFRRSFLLSAFCFLPSAVCLAAVDWNNPGAVVLAAIDVNPSLASLSAQIRAAKERVAPAGSLPNPMLMGGAQNEPVNLSYDFMTMYWVGASQTLVRKSRRDALRRSAELDVERLQREYEARRAEVERDVRSAYIEAAAAQNQVESTEDVDTLLKEVVQASRARYETGAVPQADLIRSMLEESNVSSDCDDKETPRWRDSFRFSIFRRPRLFRLFHSATPCMPRWRAASMPRCPSPRPPSQS